jgi:hypothetical protein
VPKGNRSTKQLYTVVTRSKVTFRHEALINDVTSQLISTLDFTGYD